MNKPATTVLLTALVSLILCLAGVFVVLAEGPQKPPTELYVRTDPPGARIFIDGKELGTSPGLFEVKPGLHQIVVALAGHDPGRKEIVVPATEITRVILELTKRAKGPAGTSPDGPTSKAYERELPVGPSVAWDPRFRVDLPDNDALDLDTGQTVRAAERLPDAFDVLWGNDAGGVLMRNLQGPARLLPLPDDADFQQAVREASNQLDRLKGSFIKGRPAAETRHFAVLTDQGRLAVVEVTRAKPEEGRICWSLLQLEPQRGGPARLTPIKQPGKASSASEAAERILRTYAEAVWDELLPKTEELDPQQAPSMVVRAAAEIAARHILPQKDLVARYLLAPLPQAPSIDRSQWTSLLCQSQF